ncbi:MAG: hypothetical protein DWQ05_20990 [Calditrichaeota bacterium]|nr:MAG: hypothetical protein DWQ05_20990 [Calditrichota bacterium]
MQKSLPLTILIVLFSSFSYGCQVSVNESFHVRDGEKRSAGMNTVNGTIDIGKNCVVRGTCRTVNGRIQVGDNSIIKEIQSVNGSIDIGKNVTVKRDINTVNSAIRCDEGSNISGGIFAVNANIKLNGCRVKDDIEVIVGKIVLRKKSEIHGSIIVEESDNKYEFDEPAALNIYIEEGSLIKGDINIQQKDLDVRVYLSSGGKIFGEVFGAEVIQDD